jgi:hypothetical protein
MMVNESMRVSVHTCCYEFDRDISQFPNRNTQGHLRAAAGVHSQIALNSGVPDQYPTQFRPVLNVYAEHEYGASARLVPPCTHR